MALTKIGTDGFKDDAVTTDKLANAINTERTANTAKTSTTINNNADNRVITGSGTANTLNAETNVFIESNGRLGIGTSGPSYPLHVHSGTANSNAIFESGDTAVELEFKDTTGTAFLECRNDFRLKNSSGEMVRIDSSGRVLIGTTTEGDGLADNLTIADSSNCGLTIRAGSSSLSSIFFADGTGAAGYIGQQVYNHSDNSLKWITNGSETMRLGRNGSHAQVFMNCTESFSNAMFSLQTNGTTGIGIKTSATNQQFCINFRNPNGEVGTINTSGSGTSYNTSSDYRLKENAVAISDGISRLKTLIPYRFNFKADATTTVDGFFAHEVTAVPEAITGTKDEVDSDNNPVYQGIDQSKLVPLLTAALQEAIAKIETLETKVAALEAA